MAYEIGDAIHSVCVCICVCMVTFHLSPTKHYPFYVHVTTFWYVLQAPSGLLASHQMYMWECVYSCEQPILFSIYLAAFILYLFPFQFNAFILIFYAPKIMVTPEKHLNKYV